MPDFRELKGEGSVEAQADEAWAQELSRSSSLVEDVFGGQLQDTLLCPDCGYERQRFEKFQELSLQLPKKIGQAACTLQVKHDCS